MAQGAFRANLANILDATFAAPGQHLRLGPGREGGRRLQSVHAGRVCLKGRPGDRRPQQSARASWRRRGRLQA